MKCVLLFLLLCFSLCLRADLLDDASRQLDLLEKEYWLAQRHSDGDYHEAVRSRMFKLKSSLSRILMCLRRDRKHNLVRLESGVNTLVRNFGYLKPAVVKAFYLNFKGSGMSDYTKEFRKLQKEKEEMAADESGKKKRSRRRYQTAHPNLKNVDLIEYERWIAERVSENMENFLNRNSRFYRNNVSSGSSSSQRTSKNYKGFSSNEPEKVHNCVSEYLAAIKDIRMGLVKARQLTNIEFK